MHTLLTGEFRIERGGNMFIDQRTLAEILSQNGYRTAGVAANALLDEEQGFSRGHDFYDVVPPPGENPKNLNGWIGDQVVSKGLAWLGEGEGPFFLHLHLFDPHGPYEPTIGTQFEPYRSDERYAAFEAAIPEDLRSLFSEQIYTRIETSTARYDSEILQADRAVARVLDHLDAKGLTEQTLILFTSDHGEGLWQRARNREEKGQAGLYFPPLYEGHGAMLHSEQIHVPLVISGPGVPAGVRRTEPVSLVDVMPTILARLDLAIPTRIDGSDLFAPGAERRRVPIFTICTRGTSVTVDGRWRLHQPAEYRIERHGTKTELYDLQTDPLELHPLDDPERTRRMQQLIADWRDQNRRYEDSRLGTTSSAHIDTLRRLGYTGEAEAAAGGSGAEEDKAQTGDG